jgi:two-component sensor histidine kinase
MNRHGFIAPGEPLVLVEELNHRVINEFTHAVISIDEVAARTANPEAKAALSEAIVILRAYAAAHRTLQAPHTPGPVSLGDYLAGICAALCSARLRHQGVRLTLKPGSAMLDAALCWRVGLIVAELVTNAVRHGFGGGAGEIDIEFVVVGGAVQCRVRDNGRAVDEAPPARGRFLVEALATDLGGDVEWRFSPNGATVLLTVPLDPMRECEDRVPDGVRATSRATTPC